MNMVDKDQWKRASYKPFVLAFLCTVFILYSNYFFYSLLNILLYCNNIGKSEKKSDENCWVCETLLVDRAVFQNIFQQCFA